MRPRISIYEGLSIRRSMVRNAFFCKLRNSSGNGIEITIKFKSWILNRTWVSVRWSVGRSIGQSVTCFFWKSRDLDPWLQITLEIPLNHWENKKLSLPLDASLFEWTCFFLTMQIQFFYVKAVVHSRHSPHNPIHLHDNYAVHKMSKASDSVHRA